MSPVHLRNQAEDRQGLFRTRRPGRGHLGNSGEWQDTEGNQTHSTINLPINQKPQTIGLEGYGSSSSAPPTPQRSFPMEHGQKEVHPRIPLGRTWSKFSEDISQRAILQRSYGNHQVMEYHQAFQTTGAKGSQDKGESSHYPSYRRTGEPARAYSDSFRLTISRPKKPSSGFPPFRHQQISGQESQFFTIPGSFQEKTRIQGQKKTSFSQMQRESDPIIQKLLDLVKEVHKSHK
ncbi:hypothetical protein O181_023843 [Austropuccinia psidii MF-1]|uniref:Uncharacterized protein n=1 Tax=Austropuccinia psidii MF-1 TaxID=1389203 RepID=A0A9Q3CHU0_9BASI|nr:hypothetical protein [Austropuccinia psidii MF-1]